MAGERDDLLALATGCRRQAGQCADELTAAALMLQALAYESLAERPGQRQIKIPEPNP